VQELLISDEVGILHLVSRPESTTVIPGAVSLYVRRICAALQQARIAGNDTCAQAPDN